MRGTITLYTAFHLKKKKKPTIFQNNNSPSLHSSLNKALNTGTQGNKTVYETQNYPQWSEEGLL